MTREKINEMIAFLKTRQEQEYIEQVYHARLGEAIWTLQDERSKLRPTPPKERN